MVFEVGKVYKHTTGIQIKILNEVDTTVHGKCLVAENVSGDLFPVGSDESNAANFTEITEAEWMNNFSKED